MSLSTIPPSSAELVEVETADGWTLHMEVFRPAGTPRGAMLLGPGMMLDRRSMDRPRGQGLASFFSERGWIAYTLDLRGKGASGPGAAQGADWTYDDLVLRDVPAAVEAVAARHPDLPRVLLGHSLVAHVGAAAVGVRPELPVDALVLLAPVVWIRPHESNPILWAIKDAVIRLWAWWTRRIGYWPARALRIGTDDESPGYVRQFAEWAREGRWGSADGAHDYRAALAHVERPTLVVAAREDLIARPAAVLAFARDLGAAATYRLEDCGVYTHHMALVDGRRCRAVWERIDRWLTAQLAGSQTTR